MRGHQKYVILENLQHKLNIILQVRKITARNRIQESRVSSVRSGWLNKIWELLKYARFEYGVFAWRAKYLNSTRLCYRFLSVPNAFEFREKVNRLHRLEFVIELCFKMYSFSVTTDSKQGRVYVSVNILKILLNTRAKPGWVASF